MYVMSLSVHVISAHADLLGTLAPYVAVVGGLLILTALLWPTASRRQGIPSRREHERRMRDLTAPSAARAARADRANRTDTLLIPSPRVASARTGTTQPGRTTQPALR